MIKPILVTMLAAAPANAGTVDCNMLTPITDGTSAYASVYSSMVRWCIDNDVTQPACAELNRLTKDADLARKSEMIAVGVNVVSVACGLPIPPKPSE